MRILHGLMAACLISFCIAGPAAIARPRQTPGDLVNAYLPTPMPANIWEEISFGFVIEPPDSHLIEQFARNYAQSGLMQRAGTRALPWLHLIIEEVRARRLPTELALLPFVESAFQAAATSSVGAHGPWQFMPATGQDYGLATDRLRDERRGWLEATRAALTYLTSLHRRFGDWPLAIAAYNAGEGRVEKAISKARAAGLASDFTSLALPSETREYVPRLFAVARLVEDPQVYGIELPNKATLPLVTVTLERDMDVDIAARLAGATTKRLREWNPAISGPLIVAAAHRELLLPMENAFRFSDAVDKHAGPLSHWSLRRLEKSAMPAELARAWGVKQSDLLAANPLPSGHRYVANSTLFVPLAAAGNASQQLVRHSRLLTEPALRRVLVKARNRESLAQLARRFSVSVAQILGWNPALTDKNLQRSSVVLWVPMS